MLEVDVYDMNGKVVEKAKLSDSIFNFEPNPQVISEVVNMYLANMKIHSASTKTRSEVRGGGKKPWRQKGTGRARAGSVRSPVFKGGGVAFGPRPRKTISHIPKKKRTIALKSALSLKLNEKKIRLIQDIELKEAKSQKISEILKKIKIDNGKKALIVMNSPSEMICKAVKNLEKVRIKNPLILNALDVISSDWLILHLDSLSSLEKRI